MEYNSYLAGTLQPRRDNGFVTPQTPASLRSASPGGEMNLSMTDRGRGRGKLHDTNMSVDGSYPSGAMTPSLP
eukprot:CAMPEP_0182874574 /NCGR_PEP_ID=MMETSP0034_2-20130328/13025_1 /TAXON_ID=156128 /ORGANISM="Nephroselmis pyriformis, Strain CCMP717" /LENGTH=72 /DNA_ID=CAMNT_0025007291 /DNA_START=48 /DNA_END=263 /DNA_ORIENTATION=+